MEPGLAESVIDQQAAESCIGEKKLGERIKRLRLKRSMGLVQLGRQTGLSASFLSQLETGRVVPTLRNLARIAMVFHKDLSYFFNPEPHTLFRLHRRGDRTRLPQSGATDPAYYFENLASLVPDRALDPYLAEFLPARQNEDFRPHVHFGFEFFYLLTGTMEIRYGAQSYRLDAEDAAYFDAGTPHGYRCTGNEKASAMIVTQHQPVIPHPMVNQRPQQDSAVATSTHADSARGGKRENDKNHPIRLPEQPAAKSPASPEPHWKRNIAS